MNSAAVPAAASGLSAAMRDASRDEHYAAEQSPFISGLLRGELGKEAYAAYLLRFRAIYAALEKAVRSHQEDPLVAAFYDPALERLPAIDSDLDWWSDESLDTLNSPAAESYRRRLEAIDSGAAVLAHHYTRYLGDLSGGQVISRTLDRIFTLGGVGLQFYSFSVHPKRYKDGYRARLDALTLEADQVKSLLSEVKSAFRLNQAVLDELGAHFAVSGSRER